MNAPGLHLIGFGLARQDVDIVKRVGQGIRRGKAALLRVLGVLRSAYIEDKLGRRRLFGDLHRPRGADDQEAIGACLQSLAVTGTRTVVEEAQRFRPADIETRGGQSLQNPLARGMAG